MKSPTRQHATTPLAPCLIHRNPNDSPHQSTSPKAATFKRATSLSPVRSRGLDEASLTTIPLRACCVACLHNVDVKDQKFCNTEDWNDGVKFTKGALRLYRSSLDRKKNVGLWNGNAKNLSSEHISSYVPTVATGIKVDEVDKKFIGEKVAASGSLGLSSPPPLLDTRESLSDSESDTVIRRAKYCEGRRRAHPPSLILEDDEEGLGNVFPLPSPRRTSTSSPYASTSHVDLLTSLEEQSPYSTTTAPARVYGKQKLASISESVLPQLPSLPIPSLSEISHSTLDVSSANISSDLGDVDNSDTASSTIAIEDAHAPSLPVAVPSPSLAKRRRPSFPSASEFFRASADVLRGMSFGATTVMGPSGFSP